MTRTNRNRSAFAAGTALAALPLQRLHDQGGAARRSLRRQGRGRAAPRATSPRRSRTPKPAVLAEPAQRRLPRALLGAAYSRRAASLRPRPASTTRMELGDESARTVLGLALAAIATGDNGAALELLDDWRDAFPRPISASPRRSPGAPRRASNPRRCAAQRRRNPPRSARTWPMPMRWPGTGARRG